MSFILLEKKGAVATLVLNRPEKRNALNIALLEEFGNALKTVSEEEKTRVILIRGEGPLFCAGLDLKEMQESSLIDTSSEMIAKLLYSLQSSPKVTVAAVHGTAIAGGMGIVAACDLAVATENCRFSLSETRRGLVAAQIIALLSRQLNSRNLKELALTGKSIGAAEAKEIGLINRTASDDGLLDAANSLAGEVLKGAPGATTLTKAFIEKIYPSSLEEDLKEALACHKKMRTTEEAQEGVASFLEKRSPVWEV